MLPLHEVNLKMKYAAWGIIALIRNCFKSILNLDLECHGEQSTSQELERQTWKVTVSKCCQLFSKY
jgi:hypothetical protein